MAEPRVALVGGYGSVGRAAALQLVRWATPLRIGGRSRERAEALLAGELQHAGEAMAVDLDDQASLQRFCAGCAVVVCCAGPPQRVGDRVARAALAQGADYVDASGDDRLFARLSPLAPGAPGRAAVIGAGMMPGLSGLLPRVLARRTPADPVRLNAWVGGCGKLTHTAALDYLAALKDGFGEPQAAWRRGHRVERALAPQQQRVPFFPREVTASPFLSMESERLARTLQLGDLSWYNVFDGTNLLAALRRLSINEEGDAAVLSRAAELDAFGRAAYQLMVFQLEDAAQRMTTLMMRGTDAGQLSGAAAALATRALLRGEVAPGIHFLAEVLEPRATLEPLRQLAGTRLEIFDGAAVLEEGAL